jgi:hypothetical protein
MMTTTETMNMPTKMKHPFGRKATEPSRPKNSKSTTKTNRAEAHGAVQRLAGADARKKPTASANLRSKSRFWPRTRLSLGFAAAKVDSMLFLAVIARIAQPRESQSNDLLALSRVGHAGLTVITLVYVLLTVWQR